MKVKVGKSSIAEDAERLAAVREAVGPDVEVMVDANQAFTAAEAIRRARTYELLGIAWFEELLPADDLHRHQRLAASTCVPVAVGESFYFIQRFGDYPAAGAVGIVQVDVARIGGITPWLKVAHAAEVFNIAGSPRAHVHPIRHSFQDLDRPANGSLEASGGGAAVPAVAARCSADQHT
ncbi:enolase C-terminal domain-like protein, partial [Streptomyces sp. NPDC057611]|uniref:enolase C-terminal domain-like protein n=1 Tax=Streptomyces sp. NPDC057611 TaxID=3346182 RepID=UPI0036CC1074